MDLNSFNPFSVFGPALRDLFEISNLSKYFIVTINDKFVVNSALTLF
jgi:hypothetical protein